MRRATGVLVAVAVATAVAAGVSLAISRPWEIEGREDQVPAGVRAELETRAVATLENDAAGRQVVTRSPADRVVCVARLLGTEPPASADAKVLYVRAMCAVPAGTRVDVPVAIHVGPPVTVDIPGDGAAFTESVDKYFPYRLRPLAFAPADPALSRALDARLSGYP